jgi:hypothetical protein
MIEKKPVLVRKKQQCYVAEPSPHHLDGFEAGARCSWQIGSTLTYVHHVQKKTFYH